MKQMITILKFFAIALASFAWITFAADFLTAPNTTENIVGVLMLATIAILILYRTTHFINHLK